MVTETTITDEGSGGVPRTAAGLRLLVMSPELFSSHALPESGSITIGRSRKCEVCIDDPLASREHATLHVTVENGAPAIRIEDRGSANGTRVRDEVVRANGRTCVALGEGVIIGSTVIMVLHDRSPSGSWRLWSHVYFTARLDEECARAEKDGMPLGLARLRFGATVPMPKIVPVLAGKLAGNQGVALYAPGEYEILLLGLAESQARALIEDLVCAYKSGGLDVRSAFAWHPRDGRTGDALVAAVNSTLKGRVAPVTELTSPESAAMRRVREMAARVASSQINVLIRGETGVGKDVLARLIHNMSPRADKPFLALNCGGLSETLLESELFGHEKGTFTGANATKRGLLESADGGTVFLDELGDMPLAVQIKLLRVIEDREIRHIGALHSRTINVRFLSATHRDLEEAVVKGTFRKDLMFRLQGITLAIPPLRARREEIPVFARSFLQEFCQEVGSKDVPSISGAAMAALIEHEWEGNIRELKNVIEHAAVLCDGPEISVENLELRRREPIAPHLPVLDDPRKATERNIITEALTVCGGSQTRAAAMLQMSRRTLITKLELYRIPRPQKGAGAIDLEPASPGDELTQTPPDDAGPPSAET